MWVYIISRPIGAHGPKILYSERTALRGMEWFLWFSKQKFYMPLSSHMTDKGNKKQMNTQFTEIRDCTILTLHTNRILSMFHFLSHFIHYPIPFIMNPSIINKAVVYLYFCCMYFCDTYPTSFFAAFTFKIVLSIFP